MLQRHLVIFAKTPAMGRVKSRLAQDIGLVAAWHFYTKTAKQISHRLSRDPRWQTSIALTPDTDAHQRGPFWPQTAGRIPQGFGDLGARMGRVFEVLPPGPVIIIGTDVPAIRPHHIWQAFIALGQSDFVFGPANDGGYWLVGAKRGARGTLGLGKRLFKGVRWSSPHALDDTTKNIELGRQVAFIDTLDDIDDGKSYRKYLTLI